MGRHWRHWMLSIGIPLTLAWSCVILTLPPTTPGAEIRLAATVIQPHDPGSHTGG